MAIPIQSFSKQVSKDAPVVRTGILQSYNGYIAQVAIDGNVLNLPMLDSVSATIPVGSTVVCQVFGASGYVIGSVNTVSRTASTTWTGGFGNPPVPKPSNAGLTFTTFAVKQAATWGTPGTLTSTTVLTQDTESVGAWFYGANAFSSLAGKTIKSLEVYLPALKNTTDAYPLKFNYHTSAARASYSPSFSGTTQTISSSGWVTLSSSFVTGLSSNLSAFGLGISGTPTASISGAAPFGTLRIGWSN